MIVNSSAYMPILNQVKPTESSTNIAVAGGSYLPDAKYSSDTVQVSEAARSKMEQEFKSGELVDFTGENGSYKKGLMALGRSTMQEWESKGLNVSDEAIIASGNAFQAAFTQMVEESGPSLAGSSLALNKYQIIINSQEVPDWFRQEYQNSLSSMDDGDMKSAFENAERFVTSKPSFSSAGALANYATVENNK